MFVYVHSISYGRGTPPVSCHKLNLTEINNIVGKDTSLPYSFTPLMKIYDISQEVFTSAVYPGDDAPQMQVVKRIAQGDAYNLTNFSMCAHNGTHIDAPFHFLADGNTAEQIPLDKTVGHCFVADFVGTLTETDVQQILAQAQTAYSGAELRILFKNDVVITEESATALANAGVQLLGTTSQSFGDDNNFVAVHKTLLQADVVLLEGLVLQDVDQGCYFLCAQPLALGGSDGSPVRAILIEM